MFSKLKASIMLILACLALTSIGFASWFTTNELYGNPMDSYIIVDNVLKFDDYITFSEIKIFDVCTTGFVNEEEEISNIGEICVNLKINSKKYFENFDSSSKISFFIMLDATNGTNLFNNSDLLNYNVYLKVDNTEYRALDGLDNQIEEFTNAPNNKLTIISFDIPKSEKDEIEVILKYQFIVKDSVDFKNELYPLFTIEDFNVEVSAKFSAYSN